MLREKNPRHEEVDPQPQGQPGAEYLKRNKEPEPQQRLIHEMKAIIGDRGQRRLRVMDAVKGPQVRIGMAPAMTPIADELRYHDHRNDLQDGRHGRKEIELHPRGISGHQAIQRPVEPGEEKDVIESAVVENEVEEIDPEGPRTVAKLPVLA